MNAPASLPLPDPLAWSDILFQVNAWRGACLHHFTVAEHAVTETLLALDAARPGVVRLRHLIGQRLEDLAAALAEGGPFAHPPASKALTRFRDRHEGFRAQLCHGAMTVAAQVGGDWLVVVDVLAIKARQGVTDTAVIRQTAGEERLAQLKRDGQALASLLGVVRKGAA